MTPAVATGERMNGKPVYAVPALSVLNMDSDFKHKLLCGGPTFTAGSACGYSCTFCYVPAIMRKGHGAGLQHSEVVIRRTGAIDALVKQLSLPSVRRRAGEPLVLYMSPLVDVAANITLRDETIEACREILARTSWHIRLLSKSNLLPSIAHALDGYRDRLIFGVSAGTLDDGLARTFELGTALVSKRLASLHQLQDEGFRTFGMICPSLPQTDYPAFARAMHDAIRADRCEHVWAEPMNVRDKSLNNTVAALRAGGYADDADRLHHVSTDRKAWEQYARETFGAYALLYRPGQLRFLQYVTKPTRDWWAARTAHAAALL
jgi:DNA repair photolyase